MILDPSLLFERRQVLLSGRWGACPKGGRYLRSRRRDSGPGDIAPYEIVEVLLARRQGDQAFVLRLLPGDSGIFFHHTSHSFYCPVALPLYTEYNSTIMTNQTCTQSPNPIDIVQADDLAPGFGQWGCTWRGLGVGGFLSPLAFGVLSGCPGRLGSLELPPRTA